MEISSESQKITLSTTAEPMPWVASPKAAVLPETLPPGTSGSVSSR